MKNNESREMYLETILVLREHNPVVRSIDVANELNFSRPSVSRAIKLLNHEGYIEIQSHGALVLTPVGELLAKTIYERHTILTNCLVAIGVSKDTAEEDACRIEHFVSDETISKLKEHLEKRR